MRFALIALGVVAISGAVANAGDTGGISGSFSLGYDYNRVDHTNVDTYGFDSALNYDTGSGVNIQLNASYTEPKIGTVPLDYWTLGGAVFWRTTDFAAGFYGDHNWIKVSSVNATYGTYGAIGEWYPSGNMTVRLRGGGLTAEGVGGGQIGGGGSYYVIPDVSLNFDATYLSWSSLHRLNLSAGAEYLPFKSFPLAVSAAYTYTQYKAGGFTVGGPGVMFRLTYRFGNGTTLVERDRNGPLNTFKTPLLEL